MRELTTGFFDPAPAGLIAAASYQPVLDADGALRLPGEERALSAGVVASFKKSPALVVLLRGDLQVHHLKRGAHLTIGRDKKNSIPLAEITASRKHAEVFYGADGWYVRDLGSSNGVLVNATKIDGPYRLSHCDRILIGSAAMYFMHPALDMPYQMPAAAQASAATADDSARSSTLQCSGCGTSNPTVARFCANCGMPIGRSVPALSQGKGR